MKETPLEFRCHPNKMHDRLKKISDDRKAGDPKLKKVVFMYIEPEASKRHGEYGGGKEGNTVEGESMSDIIACRRAEVVRASSLCGHATSDDGDCEQIGNKQVGKNRING